MTDLMSLKESEAGCENNGFHVLSLDNPSKRITSDGYPYKFKIGVDCYYSFYAPEAKNIEIYIPVYEVNYYSQYLFFLTIFLGTAFRLVSF